MTDYVADIRKFTADVNEAGAAAIVKYCGIALRSADASLVSSTDPQELATVRDGFAAKKLGLDAQATDAGIMSVVQKMKGTPQKSRVTFYCLLAKATGALGKLG